LAIKRKEGVKLGRPRTLPERVRKRIQRERGKRKSFAAIAAALNADKVATAHGGARWYASTVRNVLAAR
jgi:hypothetical protein